MAAETIGLATRYTNKGVLLWLHGSLDTRGSLATGLLTSEYVGASHTGLSCSSHNLYELFLHTTGPPHCHTTAVQYQHTYIAIEQVSDMLAL